MSRSRSALARIGAFAVLALLLSACIKLDMNLTVNSDDTVDGTIIFALNKQLIELSGQSADDLLGDSGPIPTDAQGVSTKPYEDDEFQGQEITLDGVPLAQFNDENDNGEDSLRIQHEGDTYVVSGALDLSSTGTGGATGASGFPGAEEIFKSAQMKLAITFPGPVSESNGTIDGNTVTWIPKVGERLELHAVASATGGGGSSSTLWILLAVGAIVIIVAIVVGVMAARRRGTPTGVAPDGTVAGDGTDVASAPPPAAPPASSPPPPPPPPPNEPPG